MWKVCVKIALAKICSDRKLSRAINKQSRTSNKPQSPKYTLKPQLRPTAAQLRPTAASAAVNGSVMDDSVIYDEVISLVEPEVTNKQRQGASSGGGREKLKFDPSWTSVTTSTAWISKAFPANISRVQKPKPQSKTKLYCSCSSSPSNFTTQHICLQRGGGGIPGKVVFGACPCGLTICPFLDTVSILLMVSESCKQKRRIVFNTWTAPWLCTVHCSTNNVWFILSQP